MEPLLKVVARVVKVTLNIEKERTEVTMATVSLESSSVVVGRKKGGFCVEGCVQDVCGYEGTGSDGSMRYVRPHPLSPDSSLGLSLV